MVVSVPRWSSYGGLCTQVVLIWWSLYPGGPHMVVSVPRWSSYGGEIILLRWSRDQPTVVTSDRWPFCTSGQHITTYLSHMQML